jgi:DNA-binding NarL/FixJ family response regulator
MADEPLDPVLSVLLVDDHEMVAQALRQALERVGGFEVVGWGSTLVEGARLALDREPQVVVMDYHLPDGTGADGTARILADRPGTVVVILTGSADAETAAAALEAGCTGFVSKDAPMSELVRSIKLAAAGEVVVPPALLPALVARVRPRGPSFGTDLTAREREVLGMLARGTSTDEITQMLVLSPHTVRNHIRSVLTKLDAHSRLEAVAIAVRAGLVTLD